MMQTMRAPALAFAPPDKVHVDVGAQDERLSLVHLPPELLIAISGFIDGRTLARCRLVCRRWRDVIDGSLEVQYRIELERDGMTDRPCLSVAQPSATSWTTPAQPSAVLLTRPPTAHPLLTTADRLARLRQLRHAWSTLAWTRRVSVPMPGPCCAYELVGGVFCKTQPRMPRGFGGAGVGGFGWGSLGVGVGHAHAHGQGQGHTHDDTPELGSCTLSATWLPGPSEAHTVVRDDLGIPTRDFAMDPSQDLMILFKGGEDVGFAMVAAFPGALELHVRTMSTNQTHPEAKAPVLSTPVLYPVTSVFVQIVEDVVGMMYCVDPARPRITVWNWKTGQLVADRSSGLLPAGTWDFSFINRRALFVTTGNGNGSLELFTFTCDPVDAKANDTSDSPLTSQTQTQTQTQAHPTLATSRLTHIASLHLPPLHPSVGVLSVGTHTSPFLASCPPDKPFVASNADRIHVLTVQYIRLPTADGPRTRPKVCVFVHNRVLERYLERGASGDVSSSAHSVVNEGKEAGTREVTAPMVVPWSEWGRKYTRVLPHVGTFQWLRYVHGQRVVMLLPTFETGKSTLRVLDFNVHRAFNDTNTTVDHADEHDDKNNTKTDDNPSLGKTTLERVDYPTRIIMPTIFADDVESSLPYSEARRDVQGDYSGVMIDDERLVGLKYPAFLTGDMKEIDVFAM